MALFIGFLKLRKGLMTWAVLSSFLSASATLLWNYHLSSIINALYAGIGIPASMLGAAAGSMILCAITAYGHGLITGWACETMAHDLRMGLFYHTMNMSYEAIEKMNAGERLSLLQNEISDVSAFLRSNLFTFVDDFFKFTATFSFMLWLNPSLTITANAPSFLILAYTIFSSRIIGEVAKQTQAANAAMNGFADTLISLFPVMRLYDAGRIVKKAYHTSLGLWENAAVKEERKRSGLMSLSGLLSCILLLLLFLAGGWQVMQGTAAIGTLYVFINLSGNVSGVMMNLPGRIGLFRRFAANLDRLKPCTTLIQRGNKS